jgi:hypothetical protein
MKTGERSGGATAECVVYHGTALLRVALTL